MLFVRPALGVEYVLILALHLLDVLHLDPAAAGVVCLGCADSLSQVARPLPLLLTGYDGLTLTAAGDIISVLIFHLPPLH